MRCPSCRKAAPAYDLPLPENARDAAIATDPRRSR
jgi:hypothetical protein